MNKDITNKSFYSFQVCKSHFAFKDKKIFTASQITLWTIYLLSFLLWNIFGTQQYAPKVLTITLMWNNTVGLLYALQTSGVQFIPNAHSIPTLIYSSIHTFSFCHCAYFVLFVVYIFGAEQIPAYLADVCQQKYCTVVQFTRGSSTSFW